MFGVERLLRGAPTTEQRHADRARAEKQEQTRLRSEVQPDGADAARDVVVARNPLRDGLVGRDELDHARGHRRRRGQRGGAVREAVADELRDAAAVRAIVHRHGLPLGNFPVNAGQLFIKNMVIIAEFQYLCRCKLQDIQYV